MGFEIGKNVQGSDITLAELQSKLKGEKLQQKAATIFNQFNTNQTVNDKGQQVLDTTEQVALMSFFKEIAGGKKSDSKDTNLGRGDLRNFKKNNKDGNFSFIQDLGYGDMKKIMKAFSGIVEADSDVADNDNLEISEWTQEDGEVKSVMIDGKKYTIDKDNNITDADGVKYEYKDGKLTKKEDGNKNITTTFENGVRNQEVQKGETITVGDKTYYVVDNKVEIGDKTYNVVDGKVTIDNQEYSVDTQETTTTTTYHAGGNTRAQEVVARSKDNTVTTTDFQPDGKTKTKQVVQDNTNDTTTTTNFKPDGVGKVKEEVVDNKNHTTTTTNFQADGKTRAKEVVVDNSNADSPKTTTTNYNVRGSLVNRTIEEGKGDNVKTTKIDYSAKTQTITQGNIETVETFNAYDEATGNVSGENSNIAKRVVTDKANHARTTTEPAKNTTIRTVELLDDNNNSVQRTVEFDATKKTATFKVNGKPVTLATDSKGNILANAKFLGQRMETVGDVAIRLGFQKGSAEYNAIVQQNGGANKRVAPGGNIKVPSDVGYLRGLNTDTASVDAKEQRKLYNQYQARVAAERAAKAELDRINTNINNAPARSAELARGLESGKGGVRQTYATANHKVYCANFYNNEVGGKRVNHEADAGSNNWQQHYVYNPITDSMVTLESVMDGNIGDAKVKYITESGYATLTDGRTIKISFTNFDNTMAKKVEKLTVDYEAAAADLRQDAVTSATNMPEMKDIDGNVIARTPSNVELNKKDYDRAIILNTGYKTDDIADLVYNEADEKSGGDAVKAMYSRITTHVDDNNVVEFLESYQARHGDDSSVIDTMTSEWLGYGKGHGRDYTVKTTKYLVNRLISRARAAGVSEQDLQAAINFSNKDETHYINDSDGRGRSYADNTYTQSAEPIINNLISLIKKAEVAPAPEDTSAADASATTAQEVTEEVVPDSAATELFKPYSWSASLYPKDDNSYLNNGIITQIGTNFAMAPYMFATVETITVNGQEIKAVKNLQTNCYVDWESLKGGSVNIVTPDPKEA